MTATATAVQDRRVHTTPHRIPLTRIVGVELRKSFDTRSGSWLLASIGIAAVVTTGAVIAWAPESEFSYGQFTLATGFPMSVILPIIAVLSITGEWSQRSGLATFTLVPRRGRVLLGKAIGAAIVAIAATVVTFAVGAVGNVVGSALAGTPAVWDLDTADAARFTLGTLLMVFVGFGIGALVRNSPGAIVAYMIYAFVAPGLLAFLAFQQTWFRDARPWVDFKHDQDALLQGGSLTGEQWTQLAVTSVVWVVLPLSVAVVRLLRTEVK